MKVAVYVPCFNGAVWLQECVEALLAQTHRPEQIVVVDDGSTDESAAIARGFGKHVRLIQHEENRGLAVARNTALSTIPCDVLASVDADVCAAPDWLRELLAGFDSPRTVAVGGMLIEKHQMHLADRWRAAHMAQHSGAFPLVNPPVLPGANTAVRPEIVRAIGGYDESFRTNYEDADLQHRLIAAGYRCRYTPAARAQHLRTDTPASVLKTCWGWLRPPFERAGAFRTVAGLSARWHELYTFSQRALWDDFGDGRSDLSYLSLLVGLLFPAADAAYASQKAVEHGDRAAARRFLAVERRWRDGLAPTLAQFEPSLAQRIGVDTAKLQWWNPHPAGAAMEDTADGEEGATDWLAQHIHPFLDRIPKIWWPTIVQSRTALAHESGWPDTSTSKATTKIQDPRSKMGNDWSRITATIRSRLPDLLAVIAHGPVMAGEALPGAVLDLLAVTLEQSDQASKEAVERALGNEAHRPLNVEIMAGHRLGWIPPSVLQQSLLATGTLLWGDRASLDAVPNWRPEQIDPRDALHEMAWAERHLAAGNGQLAARRAAGALLIGRRAYTARPSDRAARLVKVWPEAPEMEHEPPERFVPRARELLEAWLFTWEGNGMSKRAIKQFEALRQ